MKRLAVVVAFACLVPLAAGCSSGKKTAAARYEEGAKALEAKNFDLAISCFSDAVRDDPGSYKAWFGRGQAYGGKELWSLAVADFTEAIKLDPGSADAYAARGMAHSAAGDYDPAIADLKKAVGLGYDQSKADGIIASVQELKALRGRTGSGGADR